MKTFKRLGLKMVRNGLDDWYITGKHAAPFLAKGNKGQVMAAWLAEKAEVGIVTFERGAWSYVAGTE